MLGVVVLDVTRKNKKPYWKDTWGFRVRGRKAIELMAKLRPLLGRRRRAQIDAAISSYNPKLKCFVEEEIIEIRRLDKLEALTQREIGVKFGVCRETVNRIVTNKTHR